MKKTLLLLSLVSGLAMAATTGSFEVISNAENKVYKDYALASTDFDIEAKGEVKVTGTGFSAGGNIKYNIKDAKLVEEGDSRTKVWAKYEFPRFYGVGTSLKAVVDTKLNTEIEGNINGSVAMTDLYATVTYKGLKLVEKPAVESELGVTYKGIKNVELGAKAFGGYEKEGNKWSAGSELNAKYTGVKDVELAAMVKGKYAHDGAITIESKPSVSYTGLKNTTISASVENKVELKHDTAANTVSFTDYTAKPEISASYKYAVTEDLSLMPKITVGTELKYTELKKGDEANAKVYATPELGLTYKPISGLTLSAKAELPIELKAKKGFAVATDLVIKAKGKVAVKYEW